MTRAALRHVVHVSQLTEEELLDLGRAQARRFWAKVEVRGDCWIWLRATDKDGYGKFQINVRGARFRGDRPVQKHVRAHRFAWELWNGPIPSGLVLMHACDTPACCNPMHLSPGTQAENRADCVKKGRSPRRLTRSQEARLVALRANGLLYRDLAERFGVPMGTIGGILRRAKEAA